MTYLRHALPVYTRIYKIIYTAYLVVLGSNLAANIFLRDQNLKQPYHIGTSLCQLIMLLSLSEPFSTIVFLSSAYNLYFF